MGQPLGCLIDSMGYVRSYLFVLILLCSRIGIRPHAGGLPVQTRCLYSELVTLTAQSTI